MKSRVPCEYGNSWGVANLCLFLSYMWGTRRHVPPLVDVENSSAACSRGWRPFCELPYREATLHRSPGVEEKVFAVAHR